MPSLDRITCNSIGIDDAIDLEKDFSEEV